MSIQDDVRCPKCNKLYVEERDFEELDHSDETEITCNCGQTFRITKYEVIEYDVEEIESED